MDFIESTGTETPTMLWDPNFVTWPVFEVQANSQMMVISPDLEQGTPLIYGFDETQQTAILEFAAQGFEDASAG